MMLNAIVRAAPRASTRIALLAVVCSLAVACSTPAQKTDSHPTYALSIQSGPLEDSLESFLMQTQIEMIYQWDSIHGRQSPAVSGTLTAEEGLSRLLAGTGCRGTWSGVSFAGVQCN